MHLTPQVGDLDERGKRPRPGRLELTRALAGRYVIESREPRSGDNDRAAKALSNLPQVLQVDQRRAEGPPGWTRWQVSAKAGAPDGTYTCTESKLRYALEGGVMRCLDVPDDAPLPPELAVGTKSYREF